MMIKSEKKLAELSKLLNEDNKLFISRAITSLRDEEPFEGAIELLASLYEHTDDDSIKKMVELFMNDLKDPSLRPEVMKAIRNYSGGKTATMLVSSCWQSGQDYSDYSEDFVKIFLSTDYATAIECLTVISESAFQLSGEKKNMLIEILDNSPVQHSDKSMLAVELRSVLRG